MIPPPELPSNPAWSTQPGSPCWSVKRGFSSNRALMSALTVRVPSRTLRCHLAVGLIALAHPGCERGILASVRELSETPVVTLKGCPAGDARFSLGGSDQLPEQRLGLVAAPFGDELIHGRDPLAVM